jgi:hypothetical protein
MRIPLIFLAALAVFSIACGNEKPDEDYQSFLSIRLKDAPAAIDEVWIDVRQVRVHTNLGGWQDLATNAGVYDLMSLQNNADTLIAGQQPIPSGRMSQVRLVLGPDNALVIDSVRYPLSLSSQDEAGLILNVQQVLQQNMPYTLVIDFDAAVSIVDQGNGNYRLKPVLTAAFR